MAFFRETGHRFQGYLILASLSSIITLAFIALHSQTDVWQHISSYIAERQTAQSYVPRYAVVEEEVREVRYQVKNTTTTVYQIPRVTPYLDGVRESFELVPGLSSRLYVYSALWDVNFVRLESIKVQGYKFSRLLCVFYYTDDTSKPGVYVKPVIKELHTYKAPFTSSVVKCPVNPGVHQGKMPTFVGVVEKESEVPKKTFTVESIEGARHEFTVCVPALHGMNNAALLVQHIEMVKLFGARRIIFYNHSITANVDAALRMYAREWNEGKEDFEVLTLPWKIPMDNGKQIDIPYFAQQLAIDECHYRYKRLSQYMSFNDLDEYLTPLKHANWSELIANRLKVKPQSRVWLFRMSVLPKARPQPAKGFEEDYLRYGSSILGLTSRDKYVYGVHDREKCIINPAVIDEKAVHWVWDSYKFTDVLPLDVGMILHYRRPLNKCAPQVKERRMVDKYGKRLAAGLKRAWSKMPEVELGWSPFKTANFSDC